MNSIILIGPTIWGNEHIDCINKHGSVWLRYDSTSQVFVDSKLREMGKDGCKLFIYVPKEFDRGGKVNPPIRGSGTVEFEGIVDDYKFTDDKLVSPRDHDLKPLEPIINQNNIIYYDKPTNVVKFVNNFHLNKLNRLDPGLDIETFAIYKNDKNTPYVSYTRSKFTHDFAHKIVLAHYPASEVIK